MADAEGGDKTHSASSKQRTRFAERGEIVRSRDLMGALVLCATVSTLVMTAQASGNLLVVGMRGGLSHVGRAPDGQLLMNVGMHLGSIVIPVSFAAALASILATVALNRGSLPWRDLDVDVTRINPLPRLGQLFSFSQTGVSLLQNVAKLSVLGWVLYKSLAQKLPAFILRPPRSLFSGAQEAGQLLWDVIVRGLLALLVLGVIDYGVAWYRLERRMRMTSQQLRDEAKEDSGDPQIRARRRRRMKEIIRQGSTKDVPKADVIVVNPTHYAVAIAYKAEAMSAPKVVAKGKDAVAERIRKIARDNRIPIISQPPLARLLYKQVRVGRNVPADLFQAVAVVLAHVYRINRRRG